MNTPVAQETVPDRYGRSIGNALGGVGYPSIWLLFLTFPVVAVFQSEAGAGPRALGAAAILLFAVVYVASWWWTTPFPALGNTVNTLLWFAALSLLMVAMIPAIGAGAMSPGPFLIATLAFKLSPRTSIPLIVVLATTFVIIAVRAGAPFTYWVPSMMIFSAFLMLSISTLIYREERAQAMAHDLDLARQRESIGRDVHDLLGHSLTVITVKTELARKLLDRDPQRAAVELDEVLALSREALGEVRATVGQLRSPEWSAQLASARTALRAARIEATLPGTAVDIPEHHKPLLAWCLREAVTNVIRHSQATQCTVEAGPGHLRVDDDGVGAPSASAFGNGLRGMSERVQEAGGNLSVRPVDPGQQRPGTRLEILLP
ncbi:sensor histidine kinase [Kocuria sp.]|uniref:sensor histidine kinase n=1 Tax=Kocuria sp. TaxID=1871328 RepID=UPI0026E0555B|nr:sensor histidine kinase [Kocuria sp.]MDO5617277.1 sensor histidine kinase [Kocuria sp.]